MSRVVSNQRGLTAPSATRARGFSLIELMIAMVLGLVVIGSAGAIYIANKRSYAATEVLSRVQESSRVAFELMARDIREAAAVPCAKDIPIANVLGRTRKGTTPPAANWLYDFGNGILGLSLIHISEPTRRS